MSASTAVNVPDAFKTAFVSIKLAVLTPPNTIASSVPTMLTVMTLDTPSVVLTVIVSLYVTPALNSSWAVFMVYVHSPCVLMLNLPYLALPATFVCATNAPTPSASVAVSKPLKVCATSVSVSVAVFTPPITVASFVPAMVTVTTLVVPSVEVTVKLSVYLTLSLNSSWALSMV